MRIFAEGVQRVSGPELRGPELKRRCLSVIEVSLRLGPITPERLKEGFPIPWLKLLKLNQ